MQALIAFCATHDYISSANLWGSTSNGIQHNAVYKINAFMQKCFLKILLFCHGQECTVVEVCPQKLANFSLSQYTNKLSKSA